MSFAGKLDATRITMSRKISQTQKDKHFMWNLENKFMQAEEGQLGKRNGTREGRKAV
jgi:hypothetical protein